MVVMTKAEYLALPASQRRRHKDGTHVVQLRRGKQVTWVPVTWSR